MNVLKENSLSRYFSIIFRSFCFVRSVRKWVFVTVVELRRPEPQTVKSRSSTEQGPGGSGPGRTWRAAEGTGCAPDPERGPTPPATARRRSLKRGKEPCVCPEGSLADSSAARLPLTITTTRRSASTVSSGRRSNTSAATAGERSSWTVSAQTQEVMMDLPYVFVKPSRVSLPACRGSSSRAPRAEMTGPRTVLLFSLAVTWSLLLF